MRCASVRLLSLLYRFRSIDDIFRWSIASMELPQGTSFGRTTPCGLSEAPFYFRYPLQSFGFPIFCESFGFSGSILQRCCQSPKEKLPACAAWLRHSLLVTVAIQTLLQKELLSRFSMKALGVYP